MQSVCSHPCKSCKNAECAVVWLLSKPMVRIRKNISTPGVDARIKIAARCQAFRGLDSRSVTQQPGCHLSFSLKSNMRGNNNSSCSLCSGSMRFLENMQQTADIRKKKHCNHNHNHRKMDRLCKDCGVSHPNAVWWSPSELRFMPKHHEKQ